MRARNGSGFERQVGLDLGRRPPHLRRRTANAAGAAQARTARRRSVTDPNVVRWRGDFYRLASLEPPRLERLPPRSPRCCRPDGRCRGEPRSEDRRRAARHRLECGRPGAPRRPRGNPPREQALAVVVRIGHSTAERRDLVGEALLISNVEGWYLGRSVVVIAPPALGNPAIRALRQRLSGSEPGPLAARTHQTHQHRMIAGSTALRQAPVRRGLPISDRVDGASPHHRITACRHSAGSRERPSRSRRAHPMT